MGFLEMDSCVSQSETARALRVSQNAGSLAGSRNARNRPSIWCISAIFLRVIQVWSSANFYRLLAVRRLTYDDKVESMAVS